uniref:SWI/SNF complex subunit SMARCC1, SWI/SNF-related, TRANSCRIPTION n=1 Tax=Siphoviridae sp. ct7EW56 TaxID=2827562 RepID=A0A8S5LRS0_9CAUD|nr:MAG TPA: SWI/SNF complex subunit SMARCC1, SWI/SNF-related, TRANSCRIPTION [Siphoviridae sp. ct7EW56]
MNFFQSFRSPQQFLQSMIGNRQVMRNPMAKNAIGMAQSGDTKGIEQMARNLCREKGINPDEMINQIKSRMGM